MKRVFILCTALILILLTVTDAEAQVRKKSKSKKSKAEKTVESVSIVDNLNPEIKLGNIGFFNGFSASMKGNVGYKVGNHFTTGIGGKFFYDQFSRIGPDPSLFSYGGFLYARGKVSQEIYIQAEYASMSFDVFTGSTVDLRVNHSYPLVGLGYMSGGDKWRFGIELMYIASETARDNQGAVVEYWFGATYNF